MILKHNISFVGGGYVEAGKALSSDQVKALKASGTKYHEAKAEKKTKKETTKDVE